MPSKTTKTTKPAPGAKGALKKTKAGRAAKSTLPSTRKSRAAAAPKKASPIDKVTVTETSGPDTPPALVGKVRVAASHAPRVSQRALPSSPQKVVDSIEVKAESFRAQWIASGVIAGFSLFALGLVTGWFLRS